jgi:hypothetical protein
MLLHNKKFSYLGNQNLKPSGFIQEWDSDQLSEYVKCSEDPIYFITTYVKVITIDGGLVPLELFEYQINFIREMHENRKVLGMFPRQYGKTTCVAAYILWYILFNDSKNVAILANKASAAREVLTRLQLMYEYIPSFLQQGVRTWNKGDIGLDNNSKVFTSATSASGIRGKTVNFLYVDECAIVPNNVAEAFFTATYPTISSGTTSKIAMTSTPLGYNHWWKFWNDAEQKNNDFIPIRVGWKEWPGRNQDWYNEQLKMLGELKAAQEVDCAFLGSSNTLISANTITNLSPIQPLFSKDGLDILEYPFRGDKEAKQPAHIYMMTVDVSRGIGGDYSAFTVVDITQSPYKVVAKYRNNHVSDLLYPNIIHKVATDYNHAYVLVEIKENGQHVADILTNELEYDNVMYVTRGQGGQHITPGFGGRTASVQTGVMTSAQVKRIGCSTLKTLVEESKLLINDVDIISEISTFIETKGSFAADEGYHDDLVMTLVLFSWASTSPYFKDLTNLDMRRKIFESRIDEINSSMTPFGFYDDGQPDSTKEFEDSAGNKWYYEDAKGMMDNIGWLLK